YGLAFHRLAFELERRGAPDDLEVAQARERGDEFLRHAVGEVLVSRITGRINQRQHGDGFFGYGGAIRRSVCSKIICSTGSKERDKNERCDESASTVASRPLCSGEFLRQLRIAQLFCIEIDQMEPDAGLDFAISQVMQTRGPLSV